MLEVISKALASRLEMKSLALYQYVGQLKVVAVADVRYRQTRDKCQQEWARWLNIQWLMLNY